MAINLNMNMDINQLKALFQKPSGSGSDNPYRQLFVAGAAVVAFIIASTCLIYIPYYTAKSSTESKLQERNAMKTELNNLMTTGGNLQNKLTESKTYYEQILSYFGNSQDLRDLYQYVSTLAMQYRMSVLNIKEVEAAPNKKETKDKDKNKEKEKKTPDIVGEIKVMVELKGDYSNYMRFKQALADSPLLLSIHAETVKVEEKGDSSVVIQLEISSYAIDKQPFYEALKSYNENGEMKEQAIDINQQPKEEQIPLNTELKQEIITPEPAITAPDTNDTRETIIGVEVDDATQALAKEAEDILENTTIDTVEPAKENVPFMPERVNEDPHPIIPIDPALPPAEPLPNAKAVIVPKKEEKPTEITPEQIPATEGEAITPETPDATKPATGEENKQQQEEKPEKEPTPSPVSQHNIQEDIGIEAVQEMGAEMGMNNHEFIGPLPKEMEETITASSVVNDEEENTNETN